MNLELIQPANDEQDKLLKAIRLSLLTGEKSAARIHYDGFEKRVTAVSSHRIFSLHSIAKCLDKSAPYFVLLHGAIASHRYMMPTAKLLAKTFHVVVPDMPGHGASSKPPHALTVQEQSQVLISWIEDLGLKKVHLLANSYGCQVAAQIAVDSPAIIDHLILSDATGDPIAPTTWQQYLRLMADGYFEPPLAPLMMFLDIFDMGFTITRETPQRIKEDDIRENLPRVKAKTLVVRGSNDVICTQKWAEQITAMLPDGKLAIIPGAPHSVNSAAAEQLTKLIDDFISSACV